MPQTPNMLNIHFSHSHNQKFNSALVKITVNMNQCTINLDAMDVHTDKCDEMAV